MIHTKVKFSISDQRKLDETGFSVYDVTLFTRWYHLTFKKHQFECFKGPRTTLPKWTGIKQLLLKSVKILESGTTCYML